MQTVVFYTILTCLFPLLIARFVNILSKTCVCVYNEMSLRQGHQSDALQRRMRGRRQSLTVFSNVRLLRAGAAPAGAARWPRAAPSWSARP